MTAPLAILKANLETMETNEPINRHAGNIRQADLEACSAAEIRQAIAILAAADAGPIWPEPRE